MLVDYLLMDLGLWLSVPLLNLLLACVVALPPPPWTARNMSVVVEECSTGANQSWHLNESWLSGSATWIHWRGSGGEALCVTVAGSSPDISGASGVLLKPCAESGRAALWQYNQSSGQFMSVVGSSGCLDANVYEPERGANVCAYPHCDSRINQQWAPLGSHGLSTFGGKFCLTARLRAPPPPLPPALLFKPLDRDVQGVCVEGMQQIHPGYNGGCPCWRVPSVLVVPDTRTGSEVIFVFAEGRWMLGDGCEVPGVPQPSAYADRRAIFYRVSQDAGKTFGPIQHLVGNRSDTGIAANPTSFYLAQTKEIVVMYDCGGGNKGPICGGSDYGRTWMIRSDDLGGTWSAPRSIDPFLSTAFAGTAPGPGAGLVLEHGARKGRILVPGHHDQPTQSDVVWFSDDGGATWSLSKLAGGSHAFIGYDEPQMTQLANGQVFLSLRVDHGTSRGAATSDDGGTSFTYVDSTSGLVLPQPEGGVMQPVITVGDGTVYYAAPNGGGRSNMTVFASRNNGETWLVLHNVYAGPSAYSALGGLAGGSLIFAYERDASGCTGESCSIAWCVLAGVDALETSVIV